MTVTYTEPQVGIEPTTARRTNAVRAVGSRDFPSGEARESADLFGGLPGKGDSKPQRNRNGAASATEPNGPVKGPWFEVPAGTPPAGCRSCGQTIFWIATTGGKRMPVDCEVAGGRWPGTDFREPAGRGVSHFATCPDRDRWRQR